MCDQQSLRSACAYAQSDHSLCYSLEYSIIVKLLTEHHLEFLSLKGGCTDSSESTHVKMPHCWKSHVTAHFFFYRGGPTASQEKGNLAVYQLKITHCILIFQGVGGGGPFINLLYSAGLEISENKHLPCITKTIGIYGKKIDFYLKYQNFHLPCSLRHS